jgi:putative addiction module killer protein
MVRPSRFPGGDQGDDRTDATDPGKHVDSEVVSGIGECAINWGPGYRVYLAKEGTTLIVLFTGGTKRRQQADIERALTLFGEYKTRKRARSQPAKPDRPLNDPKRG